MPVRSSNFNGSRLRLSLSDSKLSTFGIQAMYAAGLLIWLVLTYWLNLWIDTSKTTKVFLGIPVAVFISNIITPIHGSDIVLDPQVTQGNLLSYILIAGSILAPWLTKIDTRRRWHHTRIIKVFIIIVLFLTLSQFDFFSFRYLSDVEVHINTIINTYALSFVGYAISEFFHVEYRTIDKWAPRQTYHERREDADPIYNSSASSVLTKKQKTEIQDAVTKQTLIAASRIDHIPSASLSSS